MVVVRQYGLLPPIDWGQDCHEQLFLMNKLWNRLVEIEQGYKLERAACEDKREELPAIVARRYAAVADARNSSGLWWGNYNAVCDAYRSARRWVLKAGAELRFHRFDGSGRFKNQIQGGMSAAELFSGGHSQVQVRPVSDAAFHHPARGERRRHQRTELTITVYVRGRIRRTLTFPMVMHREIPADAVIKDVVAPRSSGCAIVVMRPGTRIPTPPQIYAASQRVPMPAQRLCS